MIFRPWKLLAVLGNAARLPVPLVPALAAQIIDKKQTSTLIRYNLQLRYISEGGRGGIFFFFLISYLFFLKLGTSTLVNSDPAIFLQLVHI